MAILTLRPIADGSLLQCLIYPPTPSTHYDKVDEETPNDDVDYVYSPGYTTGIFRDSYVKPASGIPAGSIINSVRIYNRGKVSVDEYGIETGIVKTLLRDAAGNLALGSAQTPLTWTTFSTLYTTSPFTGQPWTISEIDGLQIGTECQSRWSPGATVAGQGFCTAVWLVIDYTPPAPPAIKRLFMDGFVCIIN